MNSQLSQMHLYCWFKLFSFKIGNFQAMIIKCLAALHVQYLKKVLYQYYPEQLRVLRVCNPHPH